MPQLISAENSIDLLMVEFKKLLVLKMSENVNVVGQLKPNEIEIKESEFLQEAYSRNPKMILKLLGVDINKWAIEYAKSGWLPQISASADVSYRSNSLNDIINSSNSLWSIGAKASIAVFDGFATKAKVDEAKAQYNQSTLQRDDIVDQIAVDIKNACLDTKKAKTIIDTERDAVFEAKEALRLSEVRYVNGVGINLDIFDCQVALAQVEQSLAQGIYDYIMAKSQLDLTMGKEFVEKDYI
jgi:outer membrane protein TolC